MKGHANLITTNVFILDSAALLYISSAMTSEDTKFACGRIRSGFCPWKILVHKLLALENWPVMHYLNSGPCMKLMMTLQRRKTR